MVLGVINLAQVDVELIRIRNLPHEALLVGKAELGKLSVRSPNWS